MATNEGRGKFPGSDGDSDELETDAWNVSPRTHRQANTLPNE